MEDTEPDTFAYLTWPERFSGMLSEIGVKSAPLEQGSQDLERGDYYSRYYSSSPRMVTNRGCVALEGTNIDLVQIVQKG